MNKLENIVASIQSKIVDLEDRHRRNHLVLFGIPEAANESESELRMKLTKETFETRLGVHVESVKCTHKLGSKVGLEKKTSNN